MAVLNITTNKTRAQMVTELTNWADGIKVSGNDYVWACADDITVTAEIDISGFSFSFSHNKKIQAQAGSVIKVSTVIRGGYYLPTTISLIGTDASDISLSSGNGIFQGSALRINASKGQLRIGTSTSAMQLKLLSVDCFQSGGANYLYLSCSSTGEINVNRITGASLFPSGNITMSEDSAGIHTSERFGPAKVVGQGLFTGYKVYGTASAIIQTRNQTFTAGTMNFLDAEVNPDFLGSNPKENANVIRRIKRTITFQPKDTTGAEVSGFSYRASCDRVTMPSGALSPNTQKSTETNKNYGDTYVITVWDGNYPDGSSGYPLMKNILIDKDMKIQYRKYRLMETIFKSNSYYFAVDAPVTMLKDTYTRFSTPTFHNIGTAAELYDAVRASVSYDMRLPEDLFTTDGITIVIKPTWTLKRSATATNIVIDRVAKSITIDKDSYIAKYKALKWDYTRFSGSVDNSMTGYTNMIFARSDGRANLNLQITCPPGSKDPVAGVWLFSQGLDNRAGMITGQTTGTGITNISLQVSASAKYYCTAKALGSNQYTPFVIEPIGGLGGSRDITLFVYEKNDGTPLLPTTLTPAQTAIADTFEFHTTHIDIKIPTGFSTNSRWSSTDKIWQYKAEDFIPIAYKLDVIQTALILLGRNQLMFLQEGRILISAATNAKILEQDPANKTTVGSTTNVKVSLTTISMGRIGDTDARNTFIDNSNGAIDVRGGVPINGGFSIADSNRLVVVETKANETHQRLALDSAKPLTNKSDGGITSTGITIVATEQADGSIVQTRS